MPDEAEYTYRRLPSRIYFSREFESACDSRLRPARFAYQVVDAGERHSFVEVNHELVLRTSPQGRRQLKICFYIEPRQVADILIQHFSIEDGHPTGKTVLHLRGEEIDRLVQFLELVRQAQFSDTDQVRIDADTIDQFVLTSEAAKQFILQHEELLREVVENDITSHDLVALMYRKNQLQIFEELLKGGDFFEHYKALHSKKRPEDVWQHFFETNPWILGYGLNYIFGAPLDNQKLEQVVAGFSVAGVGKRVDALLRTQGYISSLCFVEIKRPDSELVAREQYRPGVWRASPELSGGVAQLQATVQAAVDQLRRRIEFRRADGAPTGELSFLYEPRSVLIVGSLTQFSEAHGINEQKFSSFELFRRNLVRPEVITFDELHARASHIVSGGATT